MRKYVVFYLSILSFTFDRLSQWTSGFIRLSNNFAKRAGNGVPSPNLLTCINNSLHMFCSYLSVSNLNLQIDTPPWYVNVGRHPRIRLAMACVSKRLGGVSSNK